ncbi:phospholipid phosphatase-related protein type 5 [Enhydra lutris kenyoni]|uniref:Phospholipid phosphatase-related protein type 5 n=2 Tax=Mustelidae TaxID=9655 RepID=A0A2Y9IXC0_ENHLU|nr:phospholipid phosphatase-related protein type 5 [Enhydra lutris kenyoni]
MPLLPAALTSSMLYFQMVIMAGTVMLAYYFEYTDTFTVNVQGFFCHDSAYRKPYPGPEDSSAVPPVLLYSLAAGVPVLVIIVGETAVFCLQLATRDFENQEKTILTGDCCYINPLVRRTVRFLGIYAFGLFATDIFVNAGQVVTGNLAPHFLALCKPNYTALGCQQYTQFISGEEACTGNPDLIMRARKTFPSKEAALSVYAAMYLTMYITNTIKAKGTRLAKPVLCLGLMCLAFLTGLNRVAEYRNHWSDVIAGFLVGISIAVFLVVCVVNNFKGRQPENEHIHMDNLAQMPMISIPRVESPLEKWLRWCPITRRVSIVQLRKLNSHVVKQFEKVHIIDKQQSYTMCYFQIRVFCLKLNNMYKIRSFFNSRNNRKQQNLGRGNNSNRNGSEKDDYNVFRRRITSSNAGVTDIPQKPRFYLGSASGHL